MESLQFSLSGEFPDVADKCNGRLGQVRTFLEYQIEVSGTGILTQREHQQFAPLGICLDHPVRYQRNTETLNHIILQGMGIIDLGCDIQILLRQTQTLQQLFCFILRTGLLCTDNERLLQQFLQICIFTGNRRCWELQLPVHRWQ